MPIDDKILVSVIIPTYNRGKVLSKSILSVINQTHKQLEIIIIDDGSSDNTESVVSAFKDQRITFIRHKENKGVSAARNIGLRIARGNFIAFLDSDDVFLPEKIEKSLDLFTLRAGGGRLGMVASNYLYEDQTKNQELHLKVELNKKRYNPLLSTWVVRASVFKKIGVFNEGILCPGEDSEFFWRFRKLFSFEFIKDPLVIKGFSVDRSTADMAKVIELRKKTIINLLKQRNYRVAARFMNILGRECLVLNQRKEAIKWFGRAFLRYPFNLGYFVNFLKAKLKYK